MWTKLRKFRVYLGMCEAGLENGLCRGCVVKGMGDKRRGNYIQQARGNAVTRSLAGLGGGCVGGVEMWVGAG